MTAFSRFGPVFLRQIQEGLTGWKGSELEKNMAHLQKVFNLTDLETEICLFLFITVVYDQPARFFGTYLQATFFSGRGHLCRILGATRGAVNSALGKTLAHTGLVDVVPWEENSLRLSNEAQEFLEKSGGDILEGRNLRRVKSRAGFLLEDHFIAREQVDHVLSLLRKKTDTPTHVLFYGPPGTGKTSFARGLATKLADPVYEIVQHQSEDNKSGHRRMVLAACVASMSRGAGSVFIMDEADNVLNTENAWFRRGETQDKGWLNSLMDQPGLRIVWIVNRMKEIEPSVLRRFAYSIHFKPFNRQQRERLWETIVRRHRCKRLFAGADLRDFAQVYQTNAGVIDMAVKKAKETAAAGGREELLRAVRQALDAHMDLVERGNRRATRQTPENTYSLEGLNISPPVSELLARAEGFDRYLHETKSDVRHSFNLLLYGPPGTGKSEFARFLARHLGRELLVRRLSDLLDPYVGMTERHIRDAFDQAAQDGMVLLIDEADALLFLRREATRSWEISQTTELLTALEQYRGFLVCTTNRLTGMDAAAIRRFSHKIEFGFLTADGNRVFYEKMLGSIAGAAMPDPMAEKALEGVRDLAPGDFKVVRDRFAFYPPVSVTHAMLVDALRQEANIRQKQSGEKKIGF
ncbi:MAG: AAA family ATPase [Thermodesulfobacteriota bacterium]